MAAKVNKKKERTTEHLKYTFSEGELKDMSVEMAQNTIEAKELEEKKKSIDSDLKGQIDSAKARANVLAGKIREGHEYKLVECEKEIDYDIDIVTVTRLDTGEVIKSRELMDHEKQMDIFEVTIKDE